MKDKLNKKELSHLLGGVSNTGNTGSLPGGSSSNIPNGVDKEVDIANLNCANCSKNTSVVLNENEVHGCTCDCIKY